MGKIIITGAGRSGSTFLVQLLTRLGYDTGFYPGDEHYSDEVRAGCEWSTGLDYTEASHESIRDTINAGPRILKSPEWSIWLKWLLKNNLIEIDHVIIPFRDLDIAAKSRLDVGLDWLIPDDEEHRVEMQGNVHAVALGRTIEACSIFAIPYTIARFPEFVDRADYCAEVLLRSGFYDFKATDFVGVFNELANPEQIKWRV